MVWVGVLESPREGAFDRPKFSGCEVWMKLRVFSLRLDPDSGEFEDSALRAFTDEHEVLAVHEHLLHREGQPLWALLVSFRDRHRPGFQTAITPIPRRESETEVPEADRVLFETLRKWRNARAQRDGKPTYILFRNNQLADIARLRPPTVEALRDVRGVGEAKARDYAEELLALIRAAAGPEALNSESAAPEGG